MSTPSITPAQIVAAISAVAAELLNDAFISGRVEHLIVGIAGIVVPLGWMLADAIIRHGRAKAHAAITIAAAAAKSAEPGPAAAPAPPAEGTPTARKRRAR